MDNFGVIIYPREGLNGFIECIVILKWMTLCIQAELPSLRLSSGADAQPVHTHNIIIL